MTRSDRFWCTLENLSVDQLTAAFCEESEFGSVSSLWQSVISERLVRSCVLSKTSKILDLC